MRDFENEGAQLREMAKSLVRDFMEANRRCRPGGEGMRQAEIFRLCGFDWGDYEKATSSNQQYWIVALLRELQKEGQAEQVAPTGPWRLR